MRNAIPIMNLDNPDELIRANGAAEAAQTFRLREEVSDYTQLIEQLSSLYERNNELVQKLQFMNRSQADEIRSILQENNDRISERLAAIQSLDAQQLQDGITAAVSASVSTSSGEARDAVLEGLQKTQEQAARLKQESDDFNHRENVRVYRNIQASVISELGKQTQELKEQLDALQASVKPDPGQALLRKATFGLLIAVLAIQLIEGVGLLSLFLTMH